MLSNNRNDPKSSDTTRLNFANFAVHLTLELSVDSPGLIEIILHY